MSGFTSCKKCHANAWQALFRQKKLRLAQQVSNSLAEDWQYKAPQGLCGGFNPPSPHRGFRNALTPRYARCWAILAAWPVKLANQPKRPRSGQVRATVGASPAAGVREHDRGGWANPRTVNSLLIFKVKSTPSGEWFHHCWVLLCFGL